ncbi:MAG: hypothetical protein WD379_08475 [Dehalococcoidia bacterium]
MADRADVERVAARIIEAVSREFPGVTLALDFGTPTDDHEDAYLWIDAPTTEREEVNEIWGYAIKLVQDAFSDEDVYLVARMRGAGIIDRERTGDKE